MSTERQTLTIQRDKLLASINEKGRWDQERYNEVIDLGKRIEALPEDEPELELKPPKKGR
jgi:sulfur transfer protein SufE